MQLSINQSVWRLGFPQESSLSLVLFHIQTADIMPAIEVEEAVQSFTYVDDIIMESAMVNWLLEDITGTKV